MTTDEDRRHHISERREHAAAARHYRAEAAKWRALASCVLDNDDLAYRLTIRELLAKAESAALDLAEHHAAAALDASEALNDLGAA